jgi:hypothetical protein
MEENQVKGEYKEHWEKLCAEAAVEQDPKRLMELVQEINRMLDEKEQRLLRKRPPNAV